MKKLVILSTLFLLASNLTNAEVLYRERVEADRPLVDVSRSRTIAYDEPGYERGTLRRRGFIGAALETPGAVAEGVAGGVASILP